MSVVTPDFLKTTGTVLSSPILIPFFPPDPAMLQRTGGYFWSELCLAFEILNLLQPSHINTTAMRPFVGFRRMKPRYER